MVAMGTWKRPERLREAEYSGAIQLIPTSLRDHIQMSSA